ncbi:hypothetical protein WJX77_005063 [Trebouxia sp. C0004]
MSAHHGSAAERFKVKRKEAGVERALSKQLVTSSVSASPGATTSTLCVSAISLVHVSQRRSPTASHTAVAAGSMAPKKKTGVPNVNIGGAYRLAREDSVQEAPNIADKSEAAEEDVDAELEALAQAEAEGDQEATAGGTPEDAAPAEEASAVTNNQGDDAEDDEQEDVDAELQALAEEIGEDSAKADSDLADSNNADQASDSKVGSEAPKEAAEDLPGEDDDADMTDAEDAPPATEAGNTHEDAAGEIEDADTKETSASASLGDTSSDATPDASPKSHPVPVERPLTGAGKGASGTASGASTAAAAAAVAAAVHKGGVEANKPVFKSKKRQLAPVAAAAAPTVTPQCTPGPAAAKATAGSRAGAVMKAVALAANKAAGKFKSTAPQPKAAAAKNTNAAPAGTPAAAVPSAARPPSVGKTLVMPVAKATSANKPPAPTPVKASAKAPAKKAAPTAAEGAPTAEGTAAKGKGKGKAGDAEKAPKAPRAKNAYMFFMADRRDAVKAETPGISVGDIAKVIGEMWRGLSEEEKKPFQDLANADKDRVAKVKADLPPVAKQLKAAKEAKADKVPRAKTAYLLFCDAKREEIKAANPGASFGETGKLLAAAWKDCPAEEKARFQEQSQSAKMELQTAAAAATMTAVAAKKQKSAQAAKALVKPAASTLPDETEEEEDLAGDPEAEGGGLATLSEAADTAAGDQAGDDAGEEAANTVAAHAAAASSPATQAGGDDESDDEADRENADWDANPAECIIGHTYHNKYMVKRKGLDFTEYGLVDARAAKRQRLSGDFNDPKVPVSLEMVEEYDTFCKDFRRCVHENQDQGNLDLDNIGQESALEMCYYLGKLQEEHYLLSKPPKRKGEVDIMIKVPMLGVSMVTQRLVNVERKLRLEAEALAADRAQEAERLKGELIVLQMMATAAQGKQTSVAMEE